MPKIVYTKQVFEKHQWRKGKDGKIDMFAYSCGFCNGPVCERCSESFCEHCHPEGFDEGPCVVEEYKCPRCSANLKYRNGESFCYNCGEKLDWGGLGG